MDGIDELHVLFLFLTVVILHDERMQVLTCCKEVVYRRVCPHPVPQCPQHPRAGIILPGIVVTVCKLPFPCRQELVIILRGYIQLILINDRLNDLIIQLMYDAGGIFERHHLVLVVDVKFRIQQPFNLTEQFRDAPMRHRSGK